MSATSASRICDVPTDNKFVGRADVSENVISLPIDPDEIFELQLEQRRHDELYHPEIARLTIHHRLNHMALHFAKYSARIADAIRTRDYSDIDRTLTDIFIIAISSANILNVRLGNVMGEYGSDDLSARDLSLASENSLTEFLVDVASATGRMAKACESVDHLEPVPYRKEMTAAVVDLVRAVLARAINRNMNIADAVRERLEDVREAKIFHGHI